ncbi:S49 family peptidase [Paracoccus yeei]|uniref:S49 family peptidase n=1 Tax=Paracoccus yeei TaxID=147645 RepID=UPI00174C8D5F|nr:S49 family peptidase [Paracoccus yeei]
MAFDFNPTLMSSFQDQVALIDENRTGWFEGCLAGLNERMETIEKAAAEFVASDDFWFDENDWRAYLRPYKVKDGILHVPVRGVLLNNFPYQFGSWATGYEYIWEAVKRGCDDSAVKGIALVIDSGGGMVSGNWDLVDRIYDARSRKPIRAFAAEHAYSAAYNIASAAEHITVARTGGVGSIGVVVVHMEMSKMLESWGVTTTIIRSKPTKMEGNGYEKLSKDAQARIQERVDEFHTQFVAMVARNRGMEESAVDATDALTFMANQALENGLADEIGNLDDALTAFVATINSDEGDEPMANDNQATITKEAHDAALADASKAAKAEGVNEGAASERARITAILGSDEAKNRPAAALMMVELGIDADKAATQLAKLPEEKGSEQPDPAKSAGAGAPSGMLKAAMKAEGKHGVEANGGDDDDDQGATPTRAQRAAAMSRAI